MAVEAVFLNVCERYSVNNNTFLTISRISKIDVIGILKMLHIAILELYVYRYL